MSAAAATTYVLPPALIGRADLARLVREVEAIENDLESQRARSRGNPGTAYRMPTMSRSLNDFVETNKIDLNNDQARMQLTEALRTMKDKAPIIHMAFAVDADPEFLQKLVAWLRREIHPQALVSVGLQPALVGGVYMRTPNHVHDFSLRALLSDKRGIIMQELEGLA
ncbi:MAG: hypothetical protein WDN27_01100 [Candidatus Saccharibacteria bacterium]